MVRLQRKVDDFWYAELRLEMDIDLLKNSADFLEDKVIECRMKLSGESHIQDDPYFGLGHVLLSKTPADGVSRSSDTDKGLAESWKPNGNGWPRDHRTLQPLLSLTSTAPPSLLKQSGDRLGNMTKDPGMIFDMRSCQ